MRSGKGSPLRTGTVERCSRRATETRAPRRLALKDGELMAEGENLHLEIDARLNGGREGGEQSDEQRGHADRERYQPPTQICNGASTFRISIWALRVRESRESRGSA